MLWYVLEWKKQLTDIEIIRTYEEITIKNINKGGRLD